MSGPSIEAPYTIASLPNPLDANHGRTQAAPVYSGNGSKKRKRPEVAVGVDGEGLNIYNVQSHNLLTSYALPPQSYLCCPPSSIYLRSTASAAACRRTFLVIRDGLHSSKRRLLSITENARTKRSVESEFKGPEKRECKLRDGEILSVNVVASASDNEHSLLTSYKNGRVSFANSDLSRTHWEAAPAQDHAGKYEVEYATILDVENARNGLLKGREDVTGLLEHNGSENRAQDLLCRLVRSDRKRRLELFVFRDPTSSPVKTTKSALQLLMSYDLPLRQKQNAAAAQYELDAASGTLYQLLDGQLNIYDLSGTIPRLAKELRSGATSLNSFIRVSSSSVLALSASNATLFETSFGSVQDSMRLSAAPISDSKGKKRKRDDAEEPVSIDAICALPDTGLVVGLAGNQILALQIRGTLRELKRVRTYGTLLSNVISKGGGTRAVHDGEHGQKTKAWQEWTAKIDTLIIDDDIDGLERLVANDPTLGRQRKGKKRDRVSESNEFTNGDATAYEELWPLPEAFDPEAIDRRKALYILSKVFGIDHYGNDTLEVRIVSSKLLEWLALTGFLSVAYLQRAFRANMSGDERVNPAVKPGDIMSAISQIDDDFQTIRDILSLPVQWEAEEVVQALRFVIESFDSTPSEEPLLALPAPSPQPNGDIEMVNGDAESHVEVESESKAAENELDYVMNALSTGLEVRSDTLRVILLRLHAFPSSAVTAAMRSLMSHSEIVFFIHILRIELADGGWTSKYVEAGEEDVQDPLVNSIGFGEERSGPSDQAIQAIGDLLNCAVDAVGTSGWLVGQSSSALRTDDLIDSLRAEVSAGLEGCYEASTLGTLFTELQRCAASAGKTRTHIAQPKNLLMHEVDNEQSLLPLGSRLEQPVVPGKRGKDRKMTKMAIGREKSRHVGKYSFERIRI